MNIEILINGLMQNSDVFKGLLENVSVDQQVWKTKPDKWSLLEVVCHLFDEEREDFKTRVKCLLAIPPKDPPPIDPVGWVTERRYIDMNYNNVLSSFLKEREESIKWLKSQINSNWSNKYEHTHFGIITPYFYLSNWLAHDFLHIRQIVKLKFDYINAISDENLEYAGKW